MISTDLTRVGMPALPKELERMAIDIGQLERLANDPLLRENAEALRQLTGQLRSVMEIQFDMLAAESGSSPL